MEPVVDMEDRALLPRIAEDQLQLAYGGLGLRTRMEDIGQRARILGASLLEQRRRHGRCRSLGLRQLFRDHLLVVAGIRQRRKHLVIRRPEIEDGSQVAGHCAVPRADRGHRDAEALFQEAPHRGVVEHLRVDPAAARPRRDHIHRHARAEPVRAQADGLAAGGGAVERRIAGGVEVFAGDVDSRLAVQDTIGVVGRHRGRRHMVEEAVILIEGDEEHCLAPDLRIGG